jgi:hypothetical protein
LQPQHPLIRHLKVLLLWWCWYGVVIGEVLLCRTTLRPRRR